MNVVDRAVTLAKSAFLRCTSRTTTIGTRQVRLNRFVEIPVPIAGQYEPWSDKAYRAALASKDGLFVDVGANKGQTLRRILSMDPERSYLGFEPQIDCVFFVRKFIEQNHLNKHVILPIGLSNADRVMKLFHRGSGTDGIASTVEGFRPRDFYLGADFVCVSTGDSVLLGIGANEIAVIKIDVEGGELEVIEGLSKTLRDQAPFIFFEVLNHFLVVTGQELDDEVIAFRDDRNTRLMRHFHDFGYQVFNIRPESGLLPVSKFAPQKSRDLRLVDYVAVHDGQTGKFFELFNR